MQVSHAPCRPRSQRHAAARTPARTDIEGDDRVELPRGDGLDRLLVGDLEDLPKLGAHEEVGLEGQLLHLDVAAAARERVCGACVGMVVRYAEQAGSAKCTAVDCRGAHKSLVTGTKNRVPSLMCRSTVCPSSTVAILAA